MTFSKLDLNARNSRSEVVINTPLAGRRVPPDKSHAEIDATPGTTTAAYASPTLPFTKDLGGLEPGKYADVIAVGGDPLQGIHALRTIGFVMKGGGGVRNDWAARWHNVRLTPPVR